jgi:serine/threonine protein kinase
MVNIGKYSDSFLLAKAEELVIEKTASSKVMDVEEERRIPQFNPNEIRLGNILGRGGFCTVSEIRKIALNGEQNNEQQFSAEEDVQWQIQDREFMSKNFLRRKNNRTDTRYAIKTLSESLLNDPERFVAGVIDLAVETKFLAVIRHPNIIKMRAVSTTSPFVLGYFIVLDRLYDTLTDRMAAWKEKKTNLSGFSRVRDLKGAKKKELWVTRLMVAYELTGALKYLHDNNIVYRDLKPDNIGFDVRGDVKIFDFGLAKEIMTEEMVGNDLYQMSGNTGSLRYMAPEVAKGEPYNHLVDVFSFGILLWQMCQLETPFASYNVQKHSQYVVRNGERPPLDTKKWSRELCALMKQCWAVDIQARPHFGQVGSQLRAEFDEYLGESEGDLLDISNRTAKSLEEAHA